MGAAGQLTVLHADEEPKLWLELPEGMAFDEWVRMGRRLCASSQVVNWYIGDWWAFGEQAYGERAAAAAEGVFGRSFGALRNTAVVCRAFETSRRHDALSFSHHQEVAALPAVDADAMLEQAEQHGWSKAELRLQVAKYRMMRVGLIDEAAEDPDYVGRVAMTRLWNRSTPGARLAFLRLATKARTVEIAADFSRDRWSDDELATVRSAVEEGKDFDEVRALLPKRSSKSVMWIFYAERALLSGDEHLSDAQSQVRFEENAKSGSQSLYVALLKHHPEMVIGASLNG